MKTKFKVLVAFIVAICITTMGTVVNAATKFTDEDTDVTVTLDKDLELSETIDFKVDERVDEYDEYKDYYYSIDIDITDVKQQDINEFASTEKTYNAEIKIPLPKMAVPFDDVEKYYVEDGWDEDNNETIWKEIEAPIKEIDGKKYLVVLGEIKYIPNAWSDSITDNIDIQSGYVYFYTSIKMLKTDGSEFEISVGVHISFDSENQPALISERYVDQFGSRYIGGKVRHGVHYL